MTKIIIIGSGNVAQHLIRTFQDAASLNSKIELVQVFARQKDSVAHLIDLDKIATNFDDLLEADLYIISVSDDAISNNNSICSFKHNLTHSFDTYFIST